MYRLCLTSALLIALSACAAPPPLPTPPPQSSAPSITPELPPASTAAPIVLPSLPPGPAPAPSATLVPTAAPLVMAAPTPTPPLPQERISAETIARLRPLRQIGYGRPERSVFAPGSRLMAMLTAAGALYVQLPGLRPLRFEPDVSDLAFTSDTTVVATVTEGKTAARQLDSGKLLWEVAGTSPQFSADGSMLAVYSSNKVVVYRRGSGQLLVALGGDAAAFSPDSGSIAVGNDGNTTLYHLPDGALIKTFPGGSPRFSPAGDLLATANDLAQARGNSWLQLWQMPSGAVVMPPISQPVRSFGFSADSRQLLYVEQDYTLVTRDLASGTEQRHSLDISPYGDLSGADIAIEFSPSGLLFTMGAWTAFQIIRTTDSKVIFEDVRMNVRGFVSPDDEFVLSYTPDIDWVRLIRLSDGTPIGELRMPSYSEIAFSPDGRAMALGADDVDIYRVGDGSPLGQFRVDANQVTIGNTSHLARITFNLTGTQVYVETMQSNEGSSSSTLDLWDIASGLSTQLYDGGATYPGGIIDFNPATEAITRFSLLSEPLIQQRDGTQRLLRTLGVMEGWNLYHMAFSPDGSLIAAETGDGIVHLVRTSDVSDLASLDAGGPVKQEGELAFSPDGSLLGARRADGTLRLWSVATFGTQAPVLTLSAPFDSDGLSDFIFSADNQLLLAHTPGGISIYRAADGQLLRTILIPADRNRTYLSLDTFAIGPAGFLIGVVHGGQVTLWGVE